MNCRRKSPNSQGLLPIFSYPRAKITQSTGMNGLSGRLARAMTAANDLAVRRALEAAGEVFIDENGGEPPR
jgi:hypothetical protein